MNLKNKKIVAVLGLLFLFAFPLSTRSMGANTIGLIPAYPDPKIYGSDIRFMYNLDLKQSKIDGFRVINNRDDTVVIKLYPVDASTTSEGTYSLLLEDDLRQDVGKWMHLAVNEIEIGPRTEKTVPFEIAIPENADTGDHFGGLIMEEINTNDTLTGTGIRVLTRIGTRVYETVPGEVRKNLNITRFDYGFAGSGVASFFKDFLDINKRTLFYVGFKNGGNVKLSPKITLDVKNMFGGRTVHVENPDGGIVFPRGETNGSVIAWEGVPLLGRYTAKVTVNTAEPGIEDQTRELVIWAFPYKMAFLLILLIIIIILLRLTKTYFSEAAKEKYPIYKVKLGDNLVMLSEKFNLPWKKIARANYIGKPFEIKEGEKLFIPLTRKNKALLEQMKTAEELAPSLMERSGKSGLKKGRVFAVIIVLILIAGGSVWYVKFRNRTVHEVLPVETPVREVPKETQEKTAGGAFKKSSVNTEIITLASGELESSKRLLKKFELMGYSVSLSPDNSGKYQETTIEYAPDRKDQADMVKNDLEAPKDQTIEMKEIAGLAKDVIVYSKLDKGLYLKADDYVDQGAQN
jgi:LysM repeat protein